ncbi:helix-turn-helix domain-containing protein, partial [Streptomyces sp. NRRL B-11253]|uniref:helix-turn-helix domain-containing protein n=2 Tax=unclassified Streptomyces TaxID=2593676 RepID=UPI00131A5D98
QAEDGIRDAVVKQLKAEISAADYSVKSFAEKLGMNYFTIRRYLTGEREMPFGVFAQICAALKIDPADLMARAIARMK